MRYASVGPSEFSAPVVARSPRGTIGSSANVSSSCSSDSRRRLNGGVRGSTRVPSTSASAIVGADVRSAAVPGRSSRNSPSVLRRNGRWIGNERIPASSGARPPLIESWMYGRATSRRAPKVVSRLANSSAWVSAAGATIAAASDSSRTKRRRLVSRDERFWATGMTSRSSVRNAPIAVLIDSPRPANASPKPVVLAAAASRVSSSNMLSTSSNSTGAGVAAAIGIVAPSAKPRSSLPRVTSTNFRPSAERGRMISVESRGSGEASRSIVRSSTAIVEPSSRRLASMPLTKPTREPPIRTSLPTTRLAALGTSALSS